MTFRLSLGSHNAPSYHSRRRQSLTSIRNGHRSQPSALTKRVGDDPMALPQSPFSACKFNLIRRRSFCIAIGQVPGGFTVKSLRSIPILLSGNALGWSPLFQRTTHPSRRSKCGVAGKFLTSSSQYQ